MANSTEYDQALAELDALHRAGRIDDARYRTHRRRLLAEARRGQHPLVRRGRRVMVVSVIVSAVALVLLLVWAVYSIITMWS